MRIGPSKLASVGPMLTIFPAVCTVDVVYGQTFLSTELRSVENTGHCLLSPTTLL